MTSSRIVWIVIAATLCFFIPERGTAQVYLTKDEALQQYFPEPQTIERRNLFLTDQQVADIQARSKTKVPSKIVTYYVGRRGKTVTGYAFLETHTVRTMPETFVLVIDPDGSVRATEILAFYEPEDYLPPERWLNLFRGKRVTSDLWLKRGIPNVVGATLSAQTITDAIRRYLNLFEAAVPKEHGE